MSLDPEDFKDKPETCRECGRANVYRPYSWMLRVCEECQEQDRGDDEPAEHCPYATEDDE